MLRGAERTFQLAAPINRKVETVECFELTEQARALALLADPLGRIGGAVGAGKRSIDHAISFESERGFEFVVEIWHVFPGRVLIGPVGGVGASPG